MKKTDKTQLTPKEEELMQLLWEHGPILISKLVELYPEPRPHFNTVSTVMRRLEGKGLVGHNEVGGAFHYYAIAKKKISEDAVLAILSRIISEGAITVPCRLLWPTIKSLPTN